MGAAMTGVFAQAVASFDWGAAAVVAAVVLVLAYALRRAMRRDRGSTALPRPEVPPATLLPPVEAPRIELPKSQLEQARRAEEEAARQKAAALKAQREALAKDGTQGEAQALKSQEEEAKKEAYRAKRAAEVEEKERKAKDREEAARVQRELEAQAQLEAQRVEAARQEEARRRIEAQAGQTLSAGLAKTRSEGFIARLNGLFGGGPKVIDEKVLGELEEVLFSADIGVKTASHLVETARDRVRAKHLDSADKLKGAIRDEVSRIVDLKANTTLSGGGPPHVVMVVGVNGAGKTTTIGKLAAKAKEQGLKVVLAAGDTFRAAAAEQLDVWAERAGAQLVKGKEEADPASVIFEAIKQAQAIGAHLVIADTAGRLHTKANLMEELKKVRRVIDKALPGAPHEVLLVLDGTMGQNAIAQARQFHEAVTVTGLCITKLDGTAKGGALIGVCDELKVPVAWVGVGEKVADLKAFAPKDFVAALFD
jgi:fused signal recognition particle receptor